MYITTDGIILNNINYRESSVISRIFTLDHGKVSIIFKGAKRKNNNISSVVELANIINITYYSRGTSTLKTSKEVSLSYHYTNSHKVLLNYYYNMAIISILDKLCQEEDSHRRLYEITINTLKIIDLNQYNKDLFFLYFLLNLNSNLGFKISTGDYKLDIMINELEHNIKYIKEVNNELSKFKDIINRIKIITYNHMKNNLIDLNDVFAIKMLKNIIHE